jgi:hypothetical protein
MPEAVDAGYWLQKADQCFRLARQFPTEDVSIKLQQLGYEFVGQALSLGADPKRIPAAWRAPQTKSSSLS